jgi:hypothetical protein
MGHTVLRKPWPVFSRLLKDEDGNMIRCARAYSIATRASLRHEASGNPEHQEPETLAISPVVIHYPAREWQPQNKHLTFKLQVLIRVASRLKACAHFPSRIPVVP